MLENLELPALSQKSPPIPPVPASPTLAPSHQDQFARMSAHPPVYKEVEHCHGCGGYLSEFGSQEFNLSQLRLGV